MNLNTRFQPLVILVFLALSACSSDTGMSDAELNDFATRYAEAWSSRNPEKLAAFYSEQGILVVNDGTPSVGREAVAATAESYMTAFPDMKVAMDSIVRNGDGATFHWIWTGTNTGPGGTGRSVELTGYEEWTFDSEGFILASQGHYDEAEYERQVSADSTASVDSTSVDM